jgi:dCTP deaminase
VILSDRSIRQLILQHPDFIDPAPQDSQIQPASIDLTLGAEIRFANGETYYLNRGGFKLFPGKFILGHTRQFVNIPTDLVAQLNGKSTLARRGLMVHSTAGYIDPGFSGHITLKLANIGHEIIFLEEEMLIAQIVMIQMTTRADRPYGTDGLGSHYQLQSGATPAHAE